MEARETSAKNQMKKAEIEFYKLRDKARTNLEKGIHAFFDKKETLSSTLHFANITASGILIPVEWKLEIGDIVLTLRHPVTRRLLTLKVVGYTLDGTVKVSHKWFRILGADADGDQLVVIPMGDNKKWESFVEKENQNFGFNLNEYKEEHAKVLSEEAYKELTFEEFKADAINNYVGKQMTKELTGRLGAFVKRVLAAYALTGRTLTMEEEEAAYVIQQIAVQGKNVGKRGLYENDPQVLMAINSGKKFSMSLDIHKLSKKNRGYKNRKNPRFR